MLILLQSFDISGGVDNDLDGACAGDFVKIIDGDCNSDGTETRYCGNHDAAPFLSSGNKLCVKFFSDDSRTSKGFNASFEAVDHPARPKGAQIQNLLIFLSMHQLLRFINLPWLQRVSDHRTIWFQKIFKLSEKFLG